ncbi:MAG: DUF1003 domain-containing protein [Bacteroidetes bacterium]|nr:MAG: DUF1003 domain-containing protein [Bacteroidota bacterium]
MEQVSCIISHELIDAEHAYRADLLRDSIFKLILADYPDLKRSDYISNDCLNTYRKRYLENLIQQESRELDHLEKEVIEAISGSQILSENIEPEIDEKLTIGQRFADIIAEFGGSWMFILIFFGILFTWIAINVWALSRKPFDPYPFILLNLILSCLAAIQAPIIMMSQNRKEHKDRIRSEHDYKINLKAELEIKLLHEKLDHLLIHQHKQFLEIQELQTDYLEDILRLFKEKDEG